MTMTRAYNVVMHDVTSVKVKQEALEAMKTKEMQMAHEIDRVVKAGQLALDDEEEAVQGCGAKFFCGMLGRRRRAAAAQAQAQAQAGSASGEHRAHTGMDARLFGQRGKTATAADRLNHAAESVEAHAGQLGERARAARAKAKELFAAHKKPEAMAALKRAKALEKQLETASATHAALEQQVDVLAESALQKEVASALSASVASTKKKTKGLMSKAEDAVDGATELKDFADDIAQTLGTLQTDTFDDDELLEELEAMQIGEDVDVIIDPDERTHVAAAALAVTPASIGIVVDSSSYYPRVPCKAVERHKLLADDSAALTHDDALMTSGGAAM